MSPNHSLVSLALCAAGAMFGASQASAATPSDAQKTYQADRAACLAGQSNQDRATCLQEAGAALAHARRAGTGDDASQFEKNRLARCELQPPQDRPDCIRRMSGEGVIRGSVEEGGVYRELTRPVADPVREK